jgi:hypothetical protein
LEADDVTQAGFVKTLVSSRRGVCRRTITNTMTGTSTEPDAPIAPALEMRQWKRTLPRVEEAVVNIGGERLQHATVSEESFGGIGLIFDKPVSIKVHDVVGVTLDGAEMSGVVRYTRMDQRSGQRVGVEWLTAPMADKSCHSAMALIEGRLFTLFSMLETGGYDELARASRQLNDEARTLGIDDVAGRAAELTDAVVKRRGKHAILEALEHVIDSCTGATA